ncbi:MAG TPA: hypothetical protein VH797_10145 [Nitrososphaeraceae archaeon]|jgi:hypothetical protein
MESKDKVEDVTIRKMEHIEGGTTCAPCVDKRHSECDLTECLCAKNNHVVN